MERGELGTLHIQGFMGGKKVRFTTLKRQFPQAHIEAAVDAYKAWEYCGKSDTRVSGPAEFGVPPAQRNKAGNVKARNELLLAKGAAQAVADGDIPLLQLPKLKHAIDLYHQLTTKPADLDQLDNYWFYGDPGTGKSRGARVRWTGLYNKPLNKWWCDYSGQETVLLDDFSKEHACLGPHLKNWADHYAFVAETKGGGVTIRPRRIVVTSNYKPEDIWQDQQTIEAVKRRFKFEHFV